MSTETQISLDQFIEENGITAEVSPEDSNPNMDDPTPGSNHYLVTLECEARLMQVPFTMGPALTDEPDAATVLDCLASDASSIENEPDWLAWARDMGYESIEDAEKARATYETIEKQAEALRHLLGHDSYEQLIWATERL